MLTAAAPFLPLLLAVLACAPLRAQASATDAGEPAAGELPAAVAAACARGGDNAGRSGGGSVLRPNRARAALRYANPPCRCSSQKSTRARNTVARSPTW
jgi:hypothetical protein